MTQKVLSEYKDGLLLGSVVRINTPIEGPYEQLENIDHSDAVVIYVRFVMDYENFDSSHTSSQDIY